jgi:hypothetical protein
MHHYSSPRFITVAQLVLKTVIFPFQFNVIVSTKPYQDNYSNIQKGIREART